MKHVSRFQLWRFVRWGHATAEFEAHVDGCDACAGALSQRAAAAVWPAPSVSLVRVEWVALAASLVLFAAWPRATSERPVMAPAVSEQAFGSGIPDAGAPCSTFPVMTVAVLDAGGR